MLLSTDGLKVQHNTSILIMTFYMQRFWNGIFSFSKGNTLANINYNRVEAGPYVSLKHCYCF